jgi:hypothetical protein
MLKVLEARKVKVPPRTKSAVELLEEAAMPAGVHRAEGWLDKHLTEYSCQEDDRPAAIAKKLGVDADQLVALNRILYPTLNKTVPLKAGTLLRLPPPLSASGRAERPQWWQPSLDIVVKLKKMRQADPFLTPVDWEEMGLVEYPFIISQPMDLGTVEEKLLCNSYVSPAQVERDVRLIFDNAMHFNQPEDAVHQMAGKLLKLFSCLWVQANLDSCSVAKVSVYTISLFLSLHYLIYLWMDVFFSLSICTQRALEPETHTEPARACARENNPCTHAHTDGGDWRRKQVQETQVHVQQGSSHRRRPPGLLLCAPLHPRYAVVPRSRDGPRRSLPQDLQKRKPFLKSPLYSGFI